MNYNETLEYLFRQLPMFSRVGAAAYKPGLDTSIRLDNLYSNPHRRFKSIHVAGTNGKGSTSHLIAAILQTQGYKTGLYTSPHLTDFRERIRVNGQKIPEQNVVDFIENYLNMGYEGHPSFFELTMMMAFDYFASQKVDFAVIEVGMGGRLDSTNIITPQACVITNISKDHTQFLGETPQKIAIEKAGIIKPGIPVVIGEANGEIKKVFSEKAEKEGAPIFFAQEEQLLSEACHTQNGWECSSPLIGKFKCTLKGDYQYKNIRTALSTLKMLRNIGIEISDESAKRGFEEVESLTSLRGRWSVMNHIPEIICDTGHNEAGLKENLIQLSHMMEQRENAVLRMVIGFVADKAIDDILKMLPHDAEYYITNANIPRALPVEKLAEKFKELCLDFSTYTSVEEAIVVAQKDAKESDIIYIGGSTFIVAEAFQLLEKAK